MARTLFDTREAASDATVDETVRRPDVSVVVPVSDRMDSIAELHRAYAEVLGGTGKTHEFVFVLDGVRPGPLRELQELKQREPSVEVVVLSRWFGEATALAVGFDRARADVILTVPSYFQIDPAEIPALLDEFSRTDADLLIVRRWPRIDARFNRLQSAVFHAMTRRLTGMAYRDISCGVRVMKKDVAREVELYGDLHRFFPLLAYQRGFQVVEVPARQSPRDAARRLYAPGVYLRRLLDMLTLFFIFKFTKKPLRFFGLIGSGAFGFGSLIVLYLGVYRILQLGPIANRPLLILGVLSMVVGLQLFSIGLLGEIIIFTHAGRVKDYRLRELGRPIDG